MDFEKINNKIKKVILLKYIVAVSIFMYIIFVLLFIFKLGTLIYSIMFIFMWLTVLVWDITKRIVNKVCIDILKNSQKNIDTYEYLKFLVGISPSFNRDYMVEVVFKDYDCDKIFNMYYDYIVKYVKDFKGFKELENNLKYKNLSKSKKYEILDKIYFNNTFSYKLYKDEFEEDEITKIILKKCFNWHRGNLSDDELENFRLKDIY